MLSFTAETALDALTLGEDPNAHERPPSPAQPSVEEPAGERRGARPFRDVVPQSGEDLIHIRRL